MKVSVIIPAAGNSTRMEADIRKPWIELADEPILYRTCRKLRALEGVEEVILVLHPDDMSRARGELWEELNSAGVSLITAGGETRSESVWNGVQIVSASAELIAVHDAVRPFFDPEVCAQLFTTAAEKGAAIPIVPLSDTVKRTEGDTVTETPIRRGLVKVQTPQVFQSDLFIDACEYAISTGGWSDAATDDASIVESYGSEVHVVLSTEYNFKITTPRDLRIAEALLASGIS